MTLRVATFTIAVLTDKFISPQWLLEPAIRFGAVEHDTTDYAFASGAVERFEMGDVVLVEV